MSDLRLKLTKLISRGVDDTRTVVESIDTRCADDLNAIVDYTVNEVLDIINREREFLSNHINNIPWVFHINVSIRKNWFSKWWKFRASNYAEFQIWVFKIGVGLPWLKKSIISAMDDKNGLKRIKETNESFKHKKLSWQIGRYPNCF